jgi:hypothetical protein
MMVSHLFFYELLLFILLFVFAIVIFHGRWLYDPPPGCLAPPKPARPRKRSPAHQPFPGLTHKPLCTACVPAPEQAPQPLCGPPPRMVSTRGRRCEVDTAGHFCPHPTCAYRGWVGWGNIRANGHPNGGPWRQLYCRGCQGYFQETHGTPLHGKRVPPEMLVWAVSAVAEGLGIRAVARVFAVEPNTVLAWLVKAADHARAFSRYFLHDLQVTQVQLDELFALLSEEGEVTEAEAIQRRSRSPRWVWAALDPVSRLLLTLDVGDRTLAMAQGVVHRVVQVLAPNCVPLFLTDGFKE